MRDIHVVVNQFLPAPRIDREHGVLGWASITLDQLWQVDGVAVRRTAAKRLSVFFPERIDRAGRRHRLIWPTEPWARRHIEHQVLQQLGHRLADQAVTS